MTNLDNYKEALKRLADAEKTLQQAREEYNAALNALNNDLLKDTRG